MLAQCFFQQGKLKQAYLLLKESDDKLNRYLLGLVCVQLKKYNEGEKALLPELYSMDPKNMTKQDIENIPGSAAGLYLLGLICRREHRHESAIFYFQYSLQIDPTFWSSICELSEMGVNIDLHKLFQLNENIFPEIINSATNKNFTDYTSPRDKLEKRIVAESIQDPIHSPRASSLGLSSLALRIPFASPGTIYNPRNVNTTVDPHSQHLDMDHGNLPSQQPRALFEMSNTTITPFMKSCNLQDSSIMYQDFESPSILNSKSGLMGTSIYRSKITDSFRRVSFGPTARLSFSGAGVIEQEFSNNVMMNTNRPLGKLNENDEEYPQKVHRIGSDFITKDNQKLSMTMSPIASSVETPISNINTSYTYTKQKSFLHDNEKTSNQLYMPSINENGKFIDHGIQDNATHTHQHTNENDSVSDNQNSLAWLEYSKLMLIFSSAYKFVNLYQCQDCINVLKLLPKNHFLSGFVYQQIGKAYYEMCDYRAALLSLKEMLRFEPFRIKGTEILSTVLWHLKKEKELCTLAQQVYTLLFYTI